MSDIFRSTEVMSKMKFCLVGCGNIARKHAHVLKEYLEDAEIGAFVDRDLSRAQKFSKEYGAPAFSNVSEMMREMKDQIDVFSVLTPSGAHCDNVLELATVRPAHRGGKADGAPPG